MRKRKRGYNYCSIHKRFVPLEFIEMDEGEDGQSLGMYVCLYCFEGDSK